MITLYKYRPFDDYLKPILMAGKIWFPTRAKFNDPQDLELDLVNDLDTTAYRKFLLRKACQESWSGDELQYNLAKGFTPNGDLSPEATQKIGASCAVLQKYFDGLGILSLSDKENDSLLWERYGDQGKGVCIVFNMQPSQYLIKVQYHPARPQLRLTELLLGVDAEEQIRKVLCIKTAKWADESEWRYFVKNGDTEFFCPGKIEGIRLGKKMPDKNRQTIVDWAAESKSPIRIDD